MAYVLDLVAFQLNNLISKHDKATNKKILSAFITVTLQYNDISKINETGTVPRALYLSR